VQLDQFCTPGGLANLDDLAAARGRTISFGGMVTEAEHKIGKNGRPWGGMTVEDYHGSRRMPFWRDDYIKFKDFMTEGWFLYIKGKVQMKQFRGADELEFKVTRIELLSDVLEKLAGRLRVQLNLEKVSESMVEEVCQLIEAHEGGVGVTVELHHPDAVLEMPSRRKRVELTPELLDGLDALDGVKYKVMGSGG
jgi:DNA polymerase-3 subunit alpha